MASDSTVALPLMTASVVARIYSSRRWSALLEKRDMEGVLGNPFASLGPLVFPSAVMAMFIMTQGVEFCLSYMACRISEDHHGIPETEKTIAFLTASA